MGYFDDFKSFLMRKPISEPHVDTDAEYTRHRAQAAFDSSPTGQTLRELKASPEYVKPIEKISKDQARQKPAETQGPVDERPVDVKTGARIQENGQPLPPTDDQVTKARQEQEMNRSRLLKQNLHDTSASVPGMQHSTPPTMLDSVINVMDYPASQVRAAIAKKISEQTGANVTAENLGEYVGKATAPGDPIGQAVNSLLTGIMTDPANYVPVIGLPLSAYKGVGKAALKGLEKVGDASKALGVNLAEERGTMYGKELTTPLNELTPPTGQPTTQPALPAPTALPTDVFSTTPDGVFVSDLAVREALVGEGWVMREDGVFPSSVPQVLLNSLKKNIERLAGQSQPTAQSAPAELPVFYSPTERVLEAKMPNSASPEQILGIINGAGIPTDEAKWMALDEFVRGKKSLTKDEVLNFVRAHRVQLEEVRLGQEDPAFLAKEQEWDAKVTQMEAEHNAAEDARIQAAIDAGEDPLPEGATVYESEDDFDLDALREVDESKYDELRDSAYDMARESEEEEYSRQWYNDWDTEGEVVEDESNAIYGIEGFRGYAIKQIGDGNDYEVYGGSRYLESFSDENDAQLDVAERILADEGGVPEGGDEAEAIQKILDEMPSNDHLGYDEDRAIRSFSHPNEPTIYGNDDAGYWIDGDRRGRNFSSFEDARDALADSMWDNFEVSDSRLDYAFDEVFKDYMRDIRAGREELPENVFIRGINADEDGTVRQPFQRPPLPPELSGRSNGKLPTQYESYTLSGGSNKREFLLKIPKLNYSAPHFGKQSEDLLMHFRVSDRYVDDPNAANLPAEKLNENVTRLGKQKRVLMVEEIQSDLNQAGRESGFRDPKKAKELEAQVEAARKEYDDALTAYHDIDYTNERAKHDAEQVKRAAYERYRQLDMELRAASEGPPDNPFKKEWRDLAVKRILRLAAEEGYEYVAWTTGEQQSKRYRGMLQEHVDTIKWQRSPEGTYTLKLYKNGREVSPAREELNNLEPQRLRNVLGQEMADRIVNDPGKKIVYEDEGADEAFKNSGPIVGELTGIDLTIGASGMKGFYDDILPKAVGKYVKRWDGKVGELNFKDAWDTEKYGSTKVHSVEVTPKMVNAVLNNPQSLLGGAFQTIEDHLKLLPKMIQQQLREKLPTPKAWKKLDEEGGYFALGPSLLMARAVIGGLAGAVAGDEENAIRNALLGAGLGAIASPALIGKLVERIRALKGGAGQATQAVGQTAQTANALPTPSMPEMKMAVPPAHFQKMYKQLVTSARDGVRHDVDVQAEGDLLANYGVISQTSIARLYPGSTMNDAETYALHKVLTESGKQVIDLAGAVVDDATFQEFAKAFYTHSLLLDPKRLGVEAEAGRSLRMYGVEAPADVQGMKLFLDQFSDMTGAMKEGQSPAKLVEMVKAFKTPEQLAVFAKNATKPGLKDAMMNLWINSLLSGPQTHAANILGNGATLAWGIAERQIAGLLGGEVRPNEAAAMVYGVYESFGQALRAGWEVAVNGEGASQWAGAAKVEPRPRISFQEAGLTGVPGQALDYLSAFFEGMGGRTLLATDEFFKSIAFQAELRARAMREAYNTVNAEGLTGKAARKRIQELQDKYLTDVPDDIQKDAEKFAAYSTFTNGLGEVGQWLADGSAKHPAVKLVLPFVKAPINIFKFAGSRIPLIGQMNKAFAADIAAGGARAELATAKVAMGSMIAGLGTLWAADGIITGGGPNQRKFKELTTVMKENGWQPYSINVSALKRKVKGDSTEWQKGDEFVSINRVEPLGMLLGLYANYVEIVSNSEKDETWDEVANHLTMATVKAMASKTFIKGLSQTALAFAFPDEFLGDTLNRQAVSFVPILGSSLSRQIAKTVDPVAREAEGFVEELMKSIPGLSKNLEPTLHPISGEPVYREGGLGPDLASPLYTSTYKKDPVLDEIIRNKVNIARHSGVLFGVELSQAGKTELQRIITHDVKMGGRNLHDALDHLMQSAAYKNGSTGPDGRRALLIRNIIHAFHQAGELKMMKKYPDLKQSIRDLTKEKAMKMKSVPTTPTDEAINASDLDLDALNVAGQ